MNRSVLHMEELTNSLFTHSFNLQPTRHTDNVVAISWYTKGCGRFDSWWARTPGVTTWQESCTWRDVTNPLSLLLVSYPNSPSKPNNDPSSPVQLDMLALSDSSSPSNPANLAQLDLLLPPSQQPDESHAT